MNNSTITTATTINDNYRLYKLIFGNIFLCKYIYRIVKEIGDQFINSNIENKSFTQQLNYENASLEWIVKNKKIELLKDKIKRKTKFQQFTFSTLMLTIELITTTTTSYQSDNDLLNEFYEINKQELLSSKLSENETYYKEIDILSFTVFSQNFKFYKIVLNDYLSNQGYTIADINQRFQLMGSCKYLNISMLDVSLKYGNMDIIKSVHKEIGIKKVHPEKGLFNSIHSENRNNVVNYLINEIKYIPPTKFTGVFDNHLINLMQLNHDIFKNLIEIHRIPLLYIRSSITKFTTLYKNILSITNYNQEEEELFNKFIEYFKSLVYTLSTAECDSKFNVIYKKLLHLIQYSDNQQSTSQYNVKDKYFYTLSGKEIIKHKEYKPEQPQPPQKSILNNLYSLFNTSNDTTTTTSTTTTTTTTESIKLYGEIELEPINYKSFDLKREIKRMYMLDHSKYLFEKRRDPGLACSYFKSHLEFVCQYKEYETFAILTNKIQCIESLAVSLKYADSKLVQFISKYYNNPLGAPFFKVINNLNVNTIELFKLDQFTIDQQISYFQTCAIQPGITYILRCILSTILKHLFSNSNNLNQFKESHFDQIFQILKNEKKVIHLNEVFEINETTTISQITIKTIKYLHCKYSNSPEFNWLEFNGDKIIGCGNLELISFFIENNIGYIDHDKSISNARTIQVAKYLIDRYSFKFYKDSLARYSKLDDYGSGYLFYFAFRSLINQKDTSLFIGDDRIEIDMIYLKLNYQQCKFIYSNLNGNDISNLFITSLEARRDKINEMSFQRMMVLPILQPNNLNRKYDTVLQSISHFINDINYVVSHGNINFIYSFLQDYNDYIDNNQIYLNYNYNFDLTDLSKTTLKKSFHYNEILNIINKIKK